MDLTEYLGCNQTSHSSLPYYEDLLIRSYENNGQLKPEILHTQERCIVAKVGNVLSIDQSKEILNCPVLKIFERKFIFGREQPLSNIQVKDEKLASSLWNTVKPSLEKILKESHVTTQPLGFDVSGGDWILYGLDSTFKIENIATDTDNLPCKGAQVCPSPDNRSILELVIFLNDTNSNGEINFFFPKDQSKAKPIKGVTVREEIEGMGGLEKGYNCLKISPKIGDALFFSHDILHTSNAVNSNASFVLKTEVMAECINKIHNISMTDTEKEDYSKCMNYLHQGVFCEVNDDLERAKEFYERALSLRYHYPVPPVTTLDPSLVKINASSCYALPDVIWRTIFGYISGKDINNIIKAFPGLSRLQRTFESRRFALDEKISQRMPLFIPEVEVQNGIFTCFKFHDGFFLYENMEACVRVASMYSLALMGREVKNNLSYIVRFDPDTHKVHPLSLNSLLIDTFLHRPFHGAVYAVNQTSADKKDLNVDFHNSVDRCYMSLRHNAQFVGVPLCKQMSVKVHWPEVTDKDMARLLKEECISRGSSSWLKNIPIDLKYRSTSQEGYENIENYEREYTIEEQYSYDFAFMNYVPDIIKLNLRPNHEIIEEFLLVIEQDEHVFGGYPSIIKDTCKYNKLKAYNDKYLNHHSDWLVQMATLNNIAVSFANQFYAKEHKHDKETCKRLGGKANAGQIYLKKLLDVAEKRKGSSAALISTINAPINIPEQAMCFCVPPFVDHPSSNLGGRLFTLIEPSTTVRPYNHLVFDFSSHEMTIQKVNGNDEDSSINNRRETDCIFYNALNDAFCEKETKDLVDVCKYTVNIEPISGGIDPEVCNREHFTYENYTEPCCCNVPESEILECRNLLDYPCLDHIHVIAGLKPDTHEVFLWTVYGGFNCF